MRKVKTLISNGSEGLRIIIGIDNKDLSLTLEEAKEVVSYMQCSINALEDPVDFSQNGGVISY